MGKQGNTAIRVEVLPARLGDCLLVECPRTDGSTWRMLIDGGPADTWPTLQSRLDLMDPSDQRLDVAVISHIDSDHIGGIIPFLQSSYADKVDDFWFNGRTHLPDVQKKRSVGQGETVVSALLGAEGQGPALPWNVAFGGGPIETASDTGFLEISYPGGPKVTVISPTITQLKALAAEWFKALEAAKRVTRAKESPDVLAPLDDLAAIASESTAKDNSVTNGSSIAFLLEHRGASVVLAADAFGNVLEAGLKAIAAARGVDRLAVDAFKLPHHASKSNVIDALVEAAPARHYLVSSNGDTFHHPDDAALARVVVGAPQGATLWFNYRNPRTERWADTELGDRYGYRARFPADSSDGIALELQGRSSTD